jgi:hypothetical protein
MLQYQRLRAGLDLIDVTLALYKHIFRLEPLTMAQTLDQVIASLGSIYDPQIQSVRDQQAAIPGQIANQEQALQAKQDSAFGDILNGARSRGLGFSGIPLSEQAKYTATDYLPALANLHTAGINQQHSLTDAINKINEDRFNAGNNIYQFGVQQDYAQQQLAYQKAKDAADRAAAERAASSFNPSLGGAGGPAAPQAPTASPLAAKSLSGGKSQQDAYNAVKALLLTNNKGLINNTATAIQKSAQNGNTYDLYKMQLLQQIAPQFYKGNIAYGGQILANRPTF